MAPLLQGFCSTFMSTGVTALFPGNRWLSLLRLSKKPELRQQSCAENDSALKVNQVRLDFARRKLARLQRLRATGTANERQLDEATSEFRIAELALAEATFAQLAAGEDARRAQALLTQRLILSPLSGVVVERHMLAGEFVSDRTPIMTVASIDVLHVEVDVLVMYYGQIAINKRATVFVDAPFTGQKDATVIAFDQILNSGTGMFGVRLQVENSELSLPAGGRCRIRFETISAAAPAID